MSPLVLGQVLGRFVNILTSVDKYPFQDCENFTLPIQMQLPEKTKDFVLIFCSIYGIYIKF